MAITSASCELLGDPDDLLSFTIPVTYTIPMTLPLAYPDLDRIEQLQNNNERSVPIFFYLPVDVSGLDERLTNGEIVEEVQITGLTMDVQSNTLEDVALQPFEIRIGAPGTAVTGQGNENDGSNDDWNNAVQVAVTELIPPTTPPFTGEVQATIAGDQTGASDRIAQLSFGMGIGTSLSIPEGDFTGGGQADLQFTISLGFLVAPL